jgi:PAS domain S-box-containing protein
MKKTKAQLIHELNQLRMQLTGQDESKKDRTDALDEMALERERFHAVFENTPVGVAMADDKGGLLKVNKAFEKMLGYSSDELRGMTFSDITHQDYREEDLRRFLEMLAGERDHSSIEKKYVRKDGRTITTKLTVTAIRDINDKFLYDIGMVEDITERRRAKEQTLKALREKEILLKEIHHRVKNNMTIITSMLALQSCYMDDPAVVDIFDDLINRIKSMSLVHERLYSSEDLEHVDIHSYLKTLTDDLSRSFSRPDKQISTRIDAGDVNMNIDSLIPLGLLINELVTNAYKHAFNETDKGEIRVCLDADDSGRVWLKVSDNGCGLPQGMDLADYQKTLGIRLAIELADQLDGTLSISNNPGAEFSISPRIMD